MKKFLVVVVVVGVVVVVVYVSFFFYIFMFNKCNEFTSGLEPVNLSPSTPMVEFYALLKDTL